MDYKASKNVFILFSIVSFIAKYINGIKEVPILKIPLNQETDKIIYWLYLFIFLFTIIHLIIERVKYKFIFELSLIILIFTTVTISRYWEYLNPFLIEISTSILLAFIISYFLHLSIEDISFIRSKKKSNQLKLPRIPASVRVVLIFNIFLCAFLIIIWIFFSKKYLNWGFIKQNYFLITIIPFCIFLREELLLFLKISNWKELKVRKENMKKVHDNHDRNYQELGLIKTDLSASKSKEINFYIKSEDINAIDKYYLDGNNPDELFGFGFTSLIFASAEGKINSVKKIIEHGADLNIKNSKGRTALCFASRYNYHQIVKILLEKGADPNDCSLAAESPLQIAAINGNEETVKLLLASDKIDIKRKTLMSNQTALELAMENGRGKIAKLIRNKI